MPQAGYRNQDYQKGVTMSEFKDVREFHQKFNFMVHDVPVHLTKRKLLERARFMQEELNEFIKAVEMQDLAEQADALIDLVYVAKGTAVQLGLPWKQLWDDVHRANMAKVRGVGKRGNLVDAIKPPGWVGPLTTTLLIQAGYEMTDFLSLETSDIDEKLCHDDPEHQ